MRFASRIAEGYRKQPGSLITRLLLPSGKAISASSRWLNITLSFVSAAIVFLLMFLVVADVFGRYVLNSPVRGTYEIGAAAMVGIVFCALAYTQMVGGHVMVDTIVRYFPARFRLPVEVLVCLVGGFFFAIMTYWSWYWAWEALAKHKLAGGVLAFPLFPIKLLITVGAGTTCLQFLISLVDSLKKLFSLPQREANS